MKMYCITLDSRHYEKIKNFGYIPVGLGDKINSDKFLTDKKGENISEKNPFYGEYTFHYWLWKNEIKNLGNEWIGICSYRRFWSLQSSNNDYKTLENLKENIIHKIPESYNNYESIIGVPIYINQFRFSKFMKKNFKKMIQNPSLLFNKQKRNIKFHFDLMHGDGNLEKAISLIDNKEDREDFERFVNSETAFNPYNMFICKSGEILKNYYNSIFPWLKKCEIMFGFELEGYGLKRIYAFLAERYMSFWFRKYTKFKTMPIIFKDITDLN